MSYDFQYYSGEMLRMPKKPVKPTISRNPSAVEARAWADALEEYESALSSYKEDLGWYKHEKEALHEKFKEKLRTDYGMSVEVFDVIWSEAWNEKHSYGLHEVYHEFDRLYDFIQKWARVSK